MKILSNLPGLTCISIKDVTVTIYDGKTISFDTIDFYNVLDFEDIRLVAKKARFLQDELKQIKNNLIQIEN